MNRSLRFSAPSPATAIAWIALFVVLASTAWAATVPKNSVTTKSIKKNAVNGSKVKNSSLTGADVRNNSLGGADIDESTLQQVPSADKVDGIDSASLVGRDTIVTFNVPMNRGDGDRALAAFGPFTLTGSCFANGPSNFDLRAALTTSSNGGWGFFDGVQDTSFNPGETKYLNNTVALAPNSAQRDIGSLDAFDTASGLAVQGTVYGYGGFSSSNCRYVGVFTVEKP